MPFLDFRQLRPRSAWLIVTDRRFRRARRSGENRLTWVQKRVVAGFYETSLMADSPLNDVPEEGIRAEWQGQLRAEQREEGWEGIGRLKRMRSR